jgi:hypothetical protein
MLACTSPTPNVSTVRSYCFDMFIRYVPLAPPLLEMFRYPEVAKSSNVTGTAVNMECSIKISATALRTRAACDR